MAIRFKKAFGISAETLMRIQAAHDMAAAREHADAIEIEPLAA
jgi:plasmid maintenance system antidote protein VapI